MLAELTNKDKAAALAIERAAASLAEVDLAARCANLRLAPPAADGSITLRVFGQELWLTPPPDFSAILVSSSRAAKPADRLLALHYLMCDLPLEPTGRWITFRDFPGGQFYWRPFCARSIKPLLARFGNDLDRLKRNLNRLAWQPLATPDLSARIQALGAIDVALIYRLGDDELEPTAELLFDECARRVLCAEDAAVIASRICLSLL